MTNKLFVKKNIYFERKLLNQSSLNSMCYRLFFRKSQTPNTLRVFNVTSLEPCYFYTVTHFQTESAIDHSAG